MIFLVWSPEHGEDILDAVQVEADFADEAAATDAERRDRIAAEYPAERTLRTRAPNDREVTVLVRCVPEPTYYATEVP